MIQFLDHYLLDPHWRTIKIVGKAKILGISAITVIVAPLLSRILIKLNEMETSIRQAHPALDALFPLMKYHFELPLSIKLLVGSAFCALVGKGIYTIWCPVYIEVGDNYEEFRYSQASATKALVDGFLEIMRSTDPENKGKIVSGLLTHHVGIGQPQHPETAHWDHDTIISVALSGRPAPQTTSGTFISIS